jgi:hypothetical protein
MASIGAADFTKTADRQITFKAGGHDMTLSGTDFLSFYALPQFFSYVTTAYDILRHNGIDLGNRDYMGAP